ncbi:sensor histidine kinase [Pedobacter metabolipauper]|nr:histidine kinase [Pedobacter metabolipauper]
MKKNIILIISLFVICQSSFGRQKPEDSLLNSFSNIMVKKKVAGKVCDTCKIDFAVSAEPDFSYIMTGSGHTPHRFYPLINPIKTAYRDTHHSSIQLVSNQLIGITFLPNFIIRNGKRIQLYRSFGGEDYSKLEFSAQQNSRTIISWTPLQQLGEDKNYAILGSKTHSNETVAKPWIRTFYAGTFKLDINDTLNITVRNILTKSIVKTITVIRPEDKANDFIFYQLPPGGEQLSTNLEDILNFRSGIPKIFDGRTSNLFEKDYGTICILRFDHLGDEVLQYSFEKNPDQWKSIKPLNPENAAHIVLDNNMPEGKDEDLYLRYSSQPGTIHKIKIRVKQRPFQIPWVKVAGISMLSLAFAAIGFYLWNRKNKRKLTVLKRKSEDIESQLLLLSGQLNPHFLFNSLSAIQGAFNKNNPDQANAYIGSVAAFMRDVMDNGRKEFISLQEELKIEADYLKLEQERMYFSYSIDIERETASSMIDFPPLLLQPVLENSIRHAFSPNLNAPMITIRIFSNENTLHIEIADNGCTSWDSAATPEGHGLSLVRKRIAIYNKKLESMSIGMQINYAKGIGTITKFTFQNWLS